MINTRGQCCWSVAVGCAVISLLCISSYVSRHQYYYPRHIPPRPVSVTSPVQDCNLPPGSYKAWNQGVVTLIKPQFNRSCSLLFQGDTKEVRRVSKQNKHWNSSQYDDEFQYDWVTSSNCTKIRSEFMYNWYVTSDELDFPLAFSMNIYENPQQIVRFLKVIYRPHNLYCIHYDQKSSNTFKRMIENLAKCLGNVIIPQQIVNVVRCCYTNLEAQMSCAKALYAARTNYPWRYTISLCGKELPLRTNREIIKILSRLKGTSAIKLLPLGKRELPKRFTHKYIITDDNKCHETQERLGPVPYGLEIKKNSAYIALTPEFVHFLLHNKTALDLYEFMKGVYIAEEHYYATVYWMKGVPGGYNEQFYPLVPVVADVIWTHVHKAKCSSRDIHKVCIMGSADLHQVKYKVDLDDIRGPLFHNKYFMEWDHTVMDCLEEQLVRRNKREYTNECGGPDIVYIYSQE